MKTNPVTLTRIKVYFQHFNSSIKFLCRFPTFQQLSHVIDVFHI
uniref:Uncharacterized protein n=1 Tax=Anguilla anguilla TaxID=7936 RepID=A0A0E9P5L2_ANGAN